MSAQPDALPDTQQVAVRASKFEGLQVLRFLAASAVVAFHAYGAGINYLGPYPALWLLHHGDYGVDLFFVLSGFIIFLTANGRETGGEVFLARRVLRVAPMYWLVTIAFCALMVAMPGLSRSVARPSPVYALESLFYVSFVSYSFPVIYIGWSLEYEMFFYLVVALSSFAGAWRWPVVVGVIGGLVVLGTEVGTQHAGPGIGAFLSNPIMLEFLFGILIGLTLIERRMPWLELALVGGALLCIVLIDRGQRVFIAGLPALALVAFTAFADQRRRQAKGSAPWRLLVALGDASYSIYLLQIFTVSVVCKIALKIWPSMPMPCLIIAVTIGTALMALVSYRLVEQPLHRWARRATSRQL